MIAEQFVALLASVKSTPRGWVAKCPAHDDRHPSLSIKEGDKGLLVKCWAGCTIEDICTAIGVLTRDLFFDRAADPHTVREAQRRRERERREREATRRQALLEAAAQREASDFLSAATCLDISGWSPARLDRELNRVADAYAVLAHEEADA